MPTAAQEAATAAAAGYWVDRAGAGAHQVRNAATGAAFSMWSAYDAWYDAALVARQAAEVADLSETAQDAVRGLFTEYVAQLTAELRGQTRVEVPRIRVVPIRNGADPIAVHSRPADVYRETFAFTGDETVALQRAVDRAMRLVEDDAAMAARQAQVDGMAGLGVQRYRRVLRPELSEQGPCGLCVVAADRIYRIKDLMPLHGRCKCETAPIIGDADPGLTLNQLDLKRIYAAAGSTAAEDLKRVRIQVHQHGELGPVLAVRGQKFTGPTDLRPTKDRKQNLRDLKKLIGVLDTLMDRSKSGQDLEQPLAYQRARIERLRRITAA